MKEFNILRRFGRCLSHFFKKLLDFVNMQRVLSRVLQRQTSRPVMDGGAETHSEGRRKLVVGLGNPGLDGTRHSVGMAVLAALAARLGLAERWRGDKHVSGEVIVSEHVQRVHVVLLRPRLLMNINGVSVAKAAGKYGVKPEDVLLVHDDLDKPLGKVAIKHGGSARGHNGVRSCIDCLQTDMMPRLRVGIGRPTGKTSVERYVLSRFSSEEQKVLSSVLAQSVDLLLSQLSLDSQPSPRPAEGRRAAQKGKEREPPDSAAAQS